MDSITRLQRRYKYLRSKIIYYNQKLSFQKDYLMSMINNLLTMNNLKLYQNTDSLYISILNELKNIKKKMDKNSNILK